MDFSIPSKVLKYESFLNDVLKEQLKNVHGTLDRLNGELAEYYQLKQFIETIKKTQLTEGTMKTQVDLGCNFLMQANIDNPTHINIAIGLGYYVEYSLDEAVSVIEKRVSFIDKQVEINRKRSADIKAHIKLVLHGLQQIQKLS